jgi:Fic family protein
MAELVTWLKQEAEVHPVLVAAIAQFQLVHIHPFVDGNGRTSRLLSTLCLYHGGYDFKRLFTISEFYDRDRRGFYDAIQGVRDSGMDHTGWLEFFCQGLATQMQETVERGTRAIQTDLLVREHGFNDRQALILHELFTLGKLDIGDVEQLCPDVSRRTLQRDLGRLEDSGLLERTGDTNQLQYLARTPW